MDLVTFSDRCPGPCRILLNVVLAREAIRFLAKTTFNQYTVTDIIGEKRHKIKKWKNPSKHTKTLYAYVQSIVIVKQSVNRKGIETARSMTMAQSFVIFASPRSRVAACIASLAAIMKYLFHFCIICIFWKRSIFINR